jgi:Spy/CpxP family protein refolding chaperone
MRTFPVRRRAAVVVLSACLILAGPGIARAGHPGTPPGKWWQSETFQRDLGLASDQVSRIEEVFQSMKPALMANKKDLDQREQDLSRVIGDGTATEADVLRYIDKVEASRSALGRTRSLMLFRMYRVLTPEQRTTLQRIIREQDDRSNDRGRHGRGDARQ